MRRTKRAVIMRVGTIKPVWLGPIIVLLTATPGGAQYGDGSIVGWGEEVVGVDLSAGFVSFAGGAWHSVGVKPDGSIAVWGRNNYGQCDVPAPNADFVAVASCSYHNLGLTGQ